MITLHGRITSANVQPVAWCLQELGLDFERLDVGGPFGGTGKDEYRAMSPLGLVPALTDGDQSLSECATILRYLMRKYGGHPTDPMAAAQIERWADMARGHIYPALISCIFLQFVRTPAGERDHAAIRQAEASLVQVMTVVEALIERAVLGGGNLTLADYQIGGLLYRYFELPFERAEFPGLKAYYERLCARPAYQEQVMIDFWGMKVEGA
ncbi:glutathione S-transferase [Roseibium aquae]|uniref:Glutathione S-transferase n=1 Tax=Roseibium aquae TaxID=1323746 RepID=A0A916X3U9_9HYPH|nr:glutathione S-transferase family protein [Roseibium aquae]GGB61854.1 glutathione S-transferase [Roseibium aquae]